MAGSGLYFVAMNYSVHALMYGYYCLLAGPKNVPQDLPRRADHTLPNRPDVRGYGSVLLCLVFHVLQQEFMSQRHVQPDSWRPDVCLVFVPVL